MKLNTFPSSLDVMISILQLLLPVRDYLSCTIWNVKHLLYKYFSIRIITDLFTEINYTSSGLYVNQGEDRPVLYVRIL